VTNATALNTWTTNNRDRTLYGALVANGSSNELFVGFNKWYNRRDPLSPFPQIRVNTVGGQNGTTSILAGADQFSQGNQLDTKTWELTENYTFHPMGNHTFTIGTRNEYVSLRNLFTHFSGLQPDVPLKQPWTGYDTGIRLACTFSPGGPPGGVPPWSRGRFGGVPPWWRAATCCRATFSGDRAPCPEGAHRGEGARPLLGSIACRTCYKGGAPGGRP